MEYLFLKEDMKMLDAQITKLRQTLKQTTKDLGESTQQTAETYHDNFPYEQACRDYALQKGILMELEELKKNALVIIPNPDVNFVDIGNTVTFQNITTGEILKYRIGSFRIFGDREAVMPYSSPIGDLLIDAKVGEIREGEIAGKNQRFQIIKIE